MSLSLGVNGQSKAFRSGNVCVNLNPPNELGVSSCRSGSAPDAVPFEFTVSSYHVVSPRIGYRLSDEWAPSLHGENLFDEAYCQGVGQFPTGGNSYGAARSFTFSLRGSF